MERQLPTYTIEGTEFVVDVVKNELRQEDDPGNRISFDDLQEDGRHYVLRYEPFIKNLPDEFIRYGRYLVDVIVPQKVYLDPEGMAILYNVPVAQLRGKTDNDLLSNEELLQKRYPDGAPVIYLAGNAYEILVERRLLLLTENPAHTIDLSKLAVADDNEHYLGYYHTPDKRMVAIDPGLTSLPLNVVAVNIPVEYRLDPAGFARWKGLEQETVLRDFPQEKELKAKVMPLWDTDLPALVQRNKAQLKQQRGLRM